MAEQEHLSPKELRDFSQTSFLRWFALVAEVYSVIGIALYGYSMHPSWWTFILASCVIGNRQHSLGLIAHEAVHKTTGASNFWNEIVGNIFCYFPINMTVSGYRHFHLEHHRNLGQEKDPEQVLKSGIPIAWQRPFPKMKFVTHFFRRTFFMDIGDIKRIAKLTKSRSATEKKFFLVFWASMWVLASYFHMLDYLALWIVSSFTVMRANNYFRSLAEHPVKTETIRIESPWFSRFLFPVYSDHHWEHHNFPSIPCWRLPEARQHVRNAPRVLNLREYFGVMEGSESDTVESAYEIKKAA